MLSRTGLGAGNELEPVEEEGEESKNPDGAHEIPEEDDDFGEEEESKANPENGQASGSPDASAGPYESNCFAQIQFGKETLDIRSRRGLFLAVRKQAS